MAIAGVTAAVISAGVLVGAVNARPSDQAPSPTATPRPGAAARQQQAQQRMDEVLNRLAANLGITPDKLKDAIKQTALQEVDQAVQDGRMTAEQAQRAKDAINNGTLPGLGFGPHFPGGRGGMMAGGRTGMPGLGGLRGVDNALPSFFGITADQLRTEMRDKSLAEIAQAHGKSVDDLKAFIISNVEQQTTAAVNAGKITQQMADRIVAGIKNNIDAIVNHKPGQGGPGFFGGGGMPGRHRGR